jgi:two-component system, cell cycle sensor histidine kinase and response regulator CckA
VWADVSMIEQILLNLAVNSRDAMPDGGQVTISTADMFVGPEYAAKNPDSQPGKYVRLTFQYSGFGIPAEQLPRIFEPFFSTKAPGQGTGLGLATVYGIVKQHHGWIRVFSTVGQGTTFQIHLPSSDQPLHRLPTNTGTQALPHSACRETILLAEDEDPVRNLVASALRLRGYRVHEARTGAEALAVFQRLDGQIDLLLADIVMPGGMNGHELANGLTLKKPELRVLLITGYSADPTTDQNGLPEKFACLAKPFDLDDLQRSLRDALTD